MASFNLIDQPWIPCLMGNGTAHELSLWDALDQARQVREIYDPSPLVTVSLHRLLLAVLHRVLGPRNADAWADLWERGSWDHPRLRTYLDRWCSRFDLFDAQRPFYQTPEIEPEYAVSAAKLAHEYASGNNATLFDHTSDKRGLALPPGEAARAVVALQAFAVGGLVSHRAGEDKLGHKSAKGAPLVKGAVGLLKGETLFHTLMLNLVQYDCAQDQPFACLGEDRPAWERDEPPRPGERRPLGYLDLLTWQSRRIRLFPDQREGCTVVARAAVMKGEQFPDDYELRGREPMVAFRANPTAKSGQPGWLPLGFSERRALWRDSLTLIQAASTTRVRPRTLDWAKDRAAEGLLGRSPVIPLDLHGMATDQAKVLLWRHERLPLPLALLDSKSFVERLRQALDLAEQVARLFAPTVDSFTQNGKTIQRSRPFRLLADALLSASRAGQDSSAGRAYQERVNALVEHLGPERAYWARLGAPFGRLVLALADEIERGADGRAAVAAWAEELRRAALAAFEEAVGGLDGSGRALRAVAEAQNTFRPRLKGLLKDYLTLQKEGVG